MPSFRGPERGAFSREGAAFRGCRFGARGTHLLRPRRHVVALRSCVRVCVCVRPRARVAWGEVGQVEGMSERGFRSSEPKSD